MTIHRGSLVHRGGRPGWRGGTRAEQAAPHATSNPYRRRRALCRPAVPRAGRRARHGAGPGAGRGGGRGTRPSAVVRGPGTRGPGTRGGAVPVAARRRAPPGPPVRPAAAAVAARPPGRRPGRRAGRHRAVRRCRHGPLRRHGRRPPGRQRRARRRTTDHLRAGVTGGPPGRPARRRGAAGRAARRPPRLPRPGLPALGAAARHGLPRPAGAARPRPGAAAAARGRQHRPAGNRRTWTAGVGRAAVGRRWLSAGRAAGEAAPRGARTRRRCCRPARTAAASPARSRP